MNYLETYVFCLFRYMSRLMVCLSPGRGCHTPSRLLRSEPLRGPRPLSLTEHCLGPLTQEPPGDIHSTVEGKLVKPEDLDTVEVFGVVRIPKTCKQAAREV